jgi:hypothetical protein
MNMKDDPQIAERVSSNTTWRRVMGETTYRRPVGFPL